MPHKEGITRMDTIFVSLLIILIIFGALVLGSATLPIGFERFHDPYHFLKRHLLLGVMPGLVLFYIVSKIPITFFKTHSVFFALATIALLSLVFVPFLRASFGSSQSWIQIGTLSMQPAEFAKITMLIALASFFGTTDSARARSLIRGMLPFSIFLLCITLLMMLQPDVGTLLVMYAIAIGIYFLGGLRTTHFLSLIAALLATLFFIIRNSPYRVARIMTVLNPGTDVHGTGYQLYQALIAIGSGGLFGVGLGHSRQKFLYLPEVSSDSIFAVIGEELGFSITVLFLILVVLLIVRGFRIARASSDPFVALLVSGVMIWFGAQTILNIGSVIGLLPLTGLPLPFVSHGGSATVAMLIAMGIVAAVSRTPLRSRIAQM